MSLEPTTNQNDELVQEIKALKEEVKSLKNKDNSYFIGVIQGLLIAVLVWYVVTPIVHWSTASMITFFISTPFIEKIKYWLTFPIYFIAPIVFIGVVSKMEPSGTIKFASRLWSYIIFEIILVVYSFIDAIPMFKKMWFW